MNVMKHSSPHFLTIIELLFVFSTPLLLFFFCLFQKKHASMIMKTTSNHKKKKSYVITIMVSFTSLSLAFLCGLHQYLYKTFLFIKTKYLD